MVCVTISSFTPFLKAKLRETLSACFRWWMEWSCSVPSLKNLMSFNFRMSVYLLSAVGTLRYLPDLQVKMNTLIASSLIANWVSENLSLMSSQRKLLARPSVVSFLDLRFWKIWKFLIKFYQALQLVLWCNSYKCLVI